MGLRSAEEGIFPGKGCFACLDRDEAGPIGSQKKITMNRKWYDHGENLGDRLGSLRCSLLVSGRQTGTEFRKRPKTKDNKSMNVIQ